MNDIKSAVLILVGADRIFNSGRFTVQIINMLSDVLKAKYNCKKEDIIRESQPKCYDCERAEKCLTDACFGC